MTMHGTSNPLQNFDPRRRRHGKFSRGDVLRSNVTARLCHALCHGEACFPRLHAIARSLQRPVKSAWQKWLTATTKEAVQYSTIRESRAWTSRELQAVDESGKQCAHRLQILSMRCGLPCFWQYCLISSHWFLAESTLRQVERWMIRRFHSYMHAKLCLCWPSREFEDE